MARPMELAVKLGWYIFKQKVTRRKRFPLVTMLEPLEKCNLACEGCGRIREYEPVLALVRAGSGFLDALKRIDTGLA